MPDNERILTDVEADLAWTFSPNHSIGESLFSSVSCPRISLSDKDRTLLKAQHEATAREIKELTEAKLVVIKNCRYISITNLDIIFSRFLKDGK